ncbi:MAG: TRAP transporter permease, partial [Pseudomonadota bacterium]
FTLGLGKVIAPMAFVYAPVLLFVSSTGFDFGEFTYTAASCIVGVVALSAAVVGYFQAPMGVIERVLAALAGLIFIAPSWQADLLALSLLIPVGLLQLIASRRDDTRRSPDGPHV